MSTKQKIVRLAVFLVFVSSSVFADANNEIQKNTQLHLSDHNYTLSLNPIGSALAIGRLGGRFKSAETPVVIEYEKRRGNTTLAFEFGFLNQDIDAVHADWFDGEIFHKADWHITDYMVSLSKKWYKNESLEGLYGSFGTMLEYSSVTDYSGDIEYWDKSPGASVLVYMFGEFGYQFVVFDHVSFRVGLRLGPSVLLREKENTGVYSMTEAGFSPDYVFAIVRMGFMW